MLFALLAVTLAAVPPAPEPSLDEARAVVIRSADLLEGTLGEVIAAIDEGLVEEPDKPRTGMAVYSPVEPEPDGLHGVWVVAVFTDGPADRAGVKVGDRILSVDSRRLEHELTDLVTDMLELKPGPVKLVILRGKEPLDITVVREPLECLKAVPDIIGQTTWRTRFASLRALTVMIRDKAQDQALSIAELQFLHKELQDRFVQFGALAEGLDFAINSGIRSACRAKTE